MAREAMLPESDIPVVLKMKNGDVISGYSDIKVRIIEGEVEVSPYDDEWNVIADSPDDVADGELDDVVTYLSHNGGDRDKYGNMIPLTMIDFR